MANTASPVDYQSLLSQLKTLRENVPQDPALRKELYSSLRDASLALEEPLDTVRRVSFAPLQLSLAKVAINLKLFQTLVKHEQGATVEELAKLTGAEDLLLRRILRYLASFGLIDEKGPDVFSASQTTKSLTNPGFEAGIEHHFDAQLPCWVSLPSFLESTSYRNPTSALNTPFQIAHSTELPAFVWALQRPLMFQHFNLWMSAQRHGQPTFLDAFPTSRFTESEAPSSDADAPLFVDVGGGVGHQCALLKSRIPDISRKIILQDLAPAISQSIKTQGVQATVHDFWTPQPVKNASFYYLRNVLHDYPDEKCEALLKLQIDAMGPNSLLLIDEMVVPVANAHFQAAELDLAMMTSLASMERTESQWKNLLEKVGLHVKDTFVYQLDMGSSVLVVGK